VENNVRDFIVGFLSIFYEALPFIILGAVIAGFLEELVPQQLLARFIPRSRTLAIGLSGLLGLIFPMCECGIIPVMRRLLRKGLPLSCCIAYMLAGPIINVVVILSTYFAFVNHVNGMGVVVLRITLGYLVACGTALVVEREHRKYGNKLLAPLAIPAPVALNDENNNGNGRLPWYKRLGKISETALHDFTDITVFLILGALLAAFVRQVLTQDDIANLSTNYPMGSILAMMGLAVLLCLCSEADAFVAASFTTMSAAAKLGFLVLGPMFDIKLYLMYTRVFRRRLIWTIIACTVSQVFIYCMLVHIAVQAGWLDGPFTFLQQLVGGPTALSPGMKP
jgi:uncharacterized membrane protein YraQ (UPF0718 family)